MRRVGTGVAMAPMVAGPWIRPPLLPSVFSLSPSRSSVLRRHDVKAREYSVGRVARGLFELKLRRVLLDAARGDGDAYAADGRGLVVGPLVDRVNELYVARSEERRVGKECRSRWSP